MGSDHASLSSALEVSERETQFVSQDDDDEILWEVIAITSEKPKAYKVQWAGVDPKTHKPWPQSWVPKRDCTDDLVIEWKRKLALKKKGKSKKSKRVSASSKKTHESAVSRATAATESVASGSTTTKRPTRSSATTHEPSSATINAHGKRPRSTTPSTSADGLPEISNHGVDEDNPPAKKKQKLKQEPEASLERRQLPLQKRVDEETNRRDENVSGKSGQITDIPEKRKDKGKGRAYDTDEGPDTPTPLTTSNPRSLHIKAATTTNGYTAKKRAQTPVSKVGQSSDDSVKRSKTTLTKKAPPKHKTPPTPSSALDDDFDDEPPPLERRAPPSSLQHTHRSDTHDDNIPKSSPPKSPQNRPSQHRLSPAAVERLKEFDASLLALEGAHASGSGTKANNPRVSSPEPGILQPPKETSPPPATFGQVYDEFMQVSHDIIGDDYTQPEPPEISKLAVPTAKPKLIRVGSERTSNHDSYRQGVVPETETESSNNTQSQSQPQPQPQVPWITRQPTLTSNQLLATPFRSSLISKMKPRTPGSASGSLLLYDDESAVYHSPSPGPADSMALAPDHESDSTPKSSVPRPVTTTATTSNTTRKPLRPIPQLSPSRFTPHLPPVSSGSHVEDADEVEVAELVSSIEQFSSPEKGGAGSSMKRRKKDKGKGKARESAPESGGEGAVEGVDVSLTEREDDSLEVVVMARGQQLAERAREERMRQWGGVGKQGTARKTMLTDLSKLGGSSRTRNRGTEWDKQKIFGSRRRGDVRGSEVSRKMVGSGFAARKQSEEIDKRLRDALREEEEESTQDLLGQQEAVIPVGSKLDVEMRDVPEPPDLPEREGATETPPKALQEEDIQASLPDDKLPNDEPLSHHSSRNPSIHESSPSHSVSRAQSRSQSVSSLPAQLAQEHEQDLLPPPTDPTPSTRENSPNLSPEVAPKDAPEHLGAAMTLLNVKSQEISRLDSLLVAEQAKAAALAQEVDSLRQALLTVNSGPRPEQSELELELTQVRQLLAEEKAAWEKERLALSTSITTLTQRKESADKDRDFFREQYAKASGFVSSVREENAELETRAQVAAGQAAAGVEMIKATFQLRVKTLEDDVKSWKRLAMFVMEKDERTNDDIRRRAAEEPQLRERCEELEMQYEIVLDQRAALEDDLEGSTAYVKELEAENAAWKKETTRLNVDLNEVKTKLERAGKSVEEGADKDHEMIYRCQWRPEGGNDPCEGLFLNVEDLQAHLYTGGHLRA